MKGGTPRILIIRLSAIGDVVRVLPSLQLLRDTLPDARIDWAVEKKSAGIVEGHPALDEMLVFSRGEGLFASLRSFFRFCREVRRRDYDIVIDFHGIFKSGLISGFSGAPRRHGFARPRSQELSYLFTNRKTRLSSDRLNRVEENIILCEGVLPRRKSWSSSPIFVDDETQESVDLFFDETFEGGKIVVAVHAPVEREEKQWPLENFAKLVDLLQADGRFEVVLTWGPGQFGVVEDVLERCRRNPMIAPETSDLKHYAALIKRAGLYVGGDTGPMHIAGAMGVPVVAIFGGTDPAKHAPFGSPFEIVHRGGSNDKLGDALKALAEIDPEEVYDACVRLLSKKR